MRLLAAAAALAVLFATGVVSVARSEITGLIVTAAGNGVRASAGNGMQATEASLDRPRSIFETSDGGFVWAEPFANKVRKVGPDGIVVNIAGSGAAGFSGDGGPATSATLNFVHAAAPTSDGGFLLADTLNNRIRKIAANGTISTVAGTGVGGFTGDGGPATAAQIDAPRGVAALADGGFLIPDTNNDRVRRVWPDGTITTVAGTGVDGFSGDGGPATLAQLSAPFGVAPTAAGGYLIADIGNQRIREVSATGLITTVAGNGVAGDSGDEGSATAASLRDPHNVAALADGGFVIADTSNHRIRHVDAAGVIHTVAGTGVSGFSGDGGAASGGQVAAPKGVAVTASGELLVADEQNDRIRFVGDPVAPASVFPPTISGTATSGSTLFGSAGGWSGTPPTVAYQWRRCDSAGANCSDLAGENASTYALTSSDVGSTLRFQVTATNAVGSAQATSAQSAVVAAASGQPVFVSSRASAFNSSSFPVDTPAGASAGDLLLAWVATDSTHTIASAPAGFTQLGTTQPDGSDTSVSAFWRVLQPGDPASFSGSFVGGEAGITGVLAYRSVDPSSPIEVFAQRSGPPLSPQITPSGNGRMIVALFGADPGANPRTGTPDTDPAASERLEAQNGTNGFVYAEDYLQPTAAPIALDVTWNGSESCGSFVLALRGP